MDNKELELNDDALDKVAGGAVTSVNIWTHTCNDFVCVWCGRRKASPTETEHICVPQGDAVFSNVCNECEFLYSDCGGK
ncbi:MAG: hypothetical protein E7466_06530 [Ruminococcaceae bacterium]|nr:hypothetical protein [Oscillospiraceae bacterium]